MSANFTSASVVYSDPTSELTIRARAVHILPGFAEASMCLGRAIENVESATGSPQCKCRFDGCFRWSNLQ